MINVSIFIERNTSVGMISDDFAQKINANIFSQLMDVNIICNYLRMKMLRHQNKKTVGN